jgi:hypothetical protein
MRARSKRVPLLRILALLGLILAFAFIGCGGGDDDEEPASLTKVQYVKRADDICAQTEKRQRKLLGQFQRENPKAGNSPQALEQMISVAALPPMKEQVQELAELPPPDKEAAKAEAYLNALEKGLKAAEKEPGALLAEPGAFNKAEEASQAFGFKTCRGA